jgi:hypothetical protein
MISVSCRIFIAMILAPGVLLISCSSGGGASSYSQEQKQFYVDAVNGSDSNAGTISNPWQTLTKVSASAIPFGSTIYLRRGSVWYEQLTIPSSGITIDSYGTGPLPRIDGSKEITGWTSEGGGLYSSPAVTLDSGEALGNLSENGVMMSFQTWTADAATTFSGAPAGSFSYQYPSTLYSKPASAPSANVYRASIKISGITAKTKSDIIVKNVEITRFSLHGVHYEDCIRCEVYNSMLTRGGGAVIMASPLLYAGNGVEYDNSSLNGVVDGVTIQDIFDSGISPQTWVSNQTMSSIAIRNSRISSCGFAGIEVSVLSNGGTTNSTMTGVLISGVTITNSGRGWSGRRYGTEGFGIRVIADNEAGSIRNVKIDNATISGSIGDGVKLAGDIGTVSMHRMNITDNANGISVQEPTGASAKLRLTSSLIHHNRGFGVFYDSPTAAGFELYQNTLSDNNTINMAVFNWSGSGTAKIQNNIFYGSSPMTHLYSAPTLAGAVIDNNCYKDLMNMIGYAGMTYSTVADFRAATGFESQGIGGDVAMTDPVNGNFALVSSSACKSLGSSFVGVAEDYSGYLFASPPSSGAYQYH